MPLVRRCCIVGCTSNSKDDPNQQFFQFPKPETSTVHRLWKQQCHASLSQILPFKKPVMCRHHFSPQCIGTRRLISTAVPILRLEFAEDPESFKRDPTLEEIEYKRKYAYINAVVFEWMLRWTLSGQRISITNGMVKKKAAITSQLLHCDGFEANHVWLVFFRKNYLDGFAQKLANNELQVSGMSVLLSQIVKDFKPYFPLPSADPSDEQQHQASDDEQEADDDDDDQSEESLQQQKKQRRKTHQPTTGRNSLNQSVKCDFDESGSERRQQPTLRLPPQKQRARSLQHPELKRRKLDAEDTSNHVDDLGDGESEHEDNDDSRSNSSAATGTTTKTTLAEDSEPSFAPSRKELESYAQAVAYLRPLEEFVLFKENFRAIGLISQLENILLKGERITSHFTNPKK